MSIAAAMLLSRYESNTEDLDRESRKVTELHQDRDEIKARFAMLDLPVGDHYVVYGTKTYNQKVYRINKTVDGVTVTAHEPLSVYSLKFIDEPTEVASEPVAQAEPFPPLDRAEVELLAAF